MFHTIVTHERPHLDEICAVWLLRKFGKEMFPGIEKAKIIFAGAGGEGFKGASGDDLEMAGIVMVGVGAGKFDEHSGIRVFGKKDECSSTLVAKVLEVETDPALEKILRFVKNSDLKGGNQPFDLSSMVNVLHHTYRNQPQEVIKWAIAGLEAKYREQENFLKTEDKEFAEAKKEEIQGPRGKTLLMVSAVTDSEVFNKVSRSKGASIVIQQQPSGNVQIYTSAKEKLRLYDVVRMLRLGEQRTKGNIITTDWDALSVEGKVEGAEEWYFHEQGQMLLNGSLSCPNVPPTKLTLTAIKEIVKICMNPVLFEPNRNQKCKQGICSSTKENPCPWHSYGLSKCRKVRYLYEMKK